MPGTTNTHPIHDAEQPIPLIAVGTSSLHDKG